MHVQNHIVITYLIVEHNLFSFVFIFDRQNVFEVSATKITFNTQQLGFLHLLET